VHCFTIKRWTTCFKLGFEGKEDFRIKGSFLAPMINSTRSGFTDSWTAWATNFGSMVMLRTSMSSCQRTEWRCWMGVIQTFPGNNCFPTKLTFNSTFSVLPVVAWDDDSPRERLKYQAAEMEMLQQHAVPNSSSTDNRTNSSGCSARGWIVDWLLPSSVVESLRFTLPNRLEVHHKANQLQFLKFLSKKLSKNLKKSKNSKEKYRAKSLTIGSTFKQRLRLKLFDFMNSAVRMCWSWKTNHLRSRVMARFVSRSKRSVSIALKLASGQANI